MFSNLKQHFSTCSFLKSALVAYSAGNENINRSTFEDRTDKTSCSSFVLDPFAEEAMQEFEYIEYKPCSSIKPLTSIDQNFDTDTAKLVIHEDRISQFFNNSTQSEFSCCYQTGSRPKNATEPDAANIYSNCTQFNTNHLLKPDEEFLLVKCSAIENSESKLLYINGHSVVRMKENVKKRMENATPDKVSVLLLGIDSMSRNHFIRVMPRSLDYLRKSGWFEYTFLNKVGENTFPNLAPVMTGKSSGDIGKIRKEGKAFQVIRYLWEDFKDAGYATIYGEDSFGASTFRYFKSGFKENSVDYYFQTFAALLDKKLKAGECDDINRKSGFKAFVGYQYYLDYLYQYAFDFMRMFRDKPSFGLIWSISFSHNDFNLPSSMDGKMLDYLKMLDSLKILDNTIVIFFSDHGARFGRFRRHFIGWVEERLPFFFLWIPKKFQDSHPEIVENLKKNENRLFSPYDVHLTVKHILQIVGGTEKNYKEWNVTCPNCQSIFEEIPIDRVCEDAGIREEWCACKNFEEVNLNSTITEKFANIVLEKLNKDLSDYPKCANLTLDFIRSTHKVDLVKSSGKVTDFLISFDVDPSKGIMQATVRCMDGLTCSKHEIVGPVERLNKYGSQSKCIEDAEQRKFCYCI
ncbi:CLUMA_CG009272, isoform A [Clunio marinus]|uniref:CLUMA_CG009272, isoform A n=1 Tax=Clunio marinus TaxID=568069 RepID=A0A1J1I8C7_9DIPT|nr:CLUMA_CG009272, isoform A [Clunio marinus]